MGDTYTLINYVSFINYLCYGVTILGLLVLRWKRPALHRPIKVRAPPAWASGAGADAVGIPASATCQAPLGILCALVHLVLTTAPWGEWLEYSPFADGKMRLRHSLMAAQESMSSHQNRRPYTELKEKSSFSSV